MLELSYLLYMDKVNQYYESQNSGKVILSQTIPNPNGGG
jgi:hypothetical protein